MNKTVSRIVEYPEHIDVLFYIDDELKSITVRYMFKNGVIFTFDLYIDTKEVLLKDIMHNNSITPAIEDVLDSNIDDLGYDSIDKFVESKQFKDILYIYFKHIKTKHITILSPYELVLKNITLEGIEDNGSVK